MFTKACLYPTLSQFNPIHILISYFFNIQSHLFYHLVVVNCNIWTILRIVPNIHPVLSISPPLNTVCNITQTSLHYQLTTLQWKNTNQNKVHPHVRSKLHNKIFTVIPCISILSKFYYQLMHKRIALKGVLTHWGRGF